MNLVVQPVWDKSENKQANKNTPVHSLAQLWAKKYVQSLQNDSLQEQSEKGGKNQNRTLTAEIMMQSLRGTSLQAWSKTESLIAKEVVRHRINPNLIDPWEISGDSFRIFQKAIEAYGQHTPPQKLATAIGREMGRIRKKYTLQDPRVVGFVAMQFHYTGQILTNDLVASEQKQVTEYFKVVDDHLYMPLQRAYDAAAKHDYHSPALAIVQQLLSLTSEIAQSVCRRVIDIYPSYFSYSGLLSESTIEIASIRDIEMFQIYLWVCVLEGSIEAIQQELFPLCVMLYPTLKVRWELVRQGLHLLGKEIRNRLGKEQAALFIPYFQALWEMFSPEVFPDSL